MKHTNIFKYLTGVAVIGLMASCNDFLDQEPQSSVSPEKYLKEETQLATYANQLYTDILPNHSYGYGLFGDDKDTDNQAAFGYNNRYIPGQWKTSQSSGGSYSFDKIYSCNYFFEKVLPEYEAGTLGGSAENIRQYIGEVYFLRAYEYFKRLQGYGDFPIVRKTLPDQMEPLVEASKRQPRNEVARFILSDLNEAIKMMQSGKSTEKTRLNRECALLIKSRVALFEGSWLKNFKNTPFVPNGPEWPGKSKEYNANYQYPTGDIDKEIAYFFTEAMSAAKELADAVELVDNTGAVQQSINDPANPYMDMFGAEDMSDYSEVLLWRPFSKGLGLTHNVAVAAQHGNYGIGVTRGMVDGFLMASGLPIYAAANYHGDETLSDVRKERDSRLAIFLKEPGQKNVLYESVEGDMAVPTEPYPVILNSNAEKGYSTGYALRKGNNYNQKYLGNGTNYTGALIFRGVEALLNYMEACYEKNGSLDNTALSYWTKIRARSQVDTDFNKTIAATDMTKEALNDWGAYSGGQLIDPTLYNIRRERRCELMAEGLRYMDLIRWRAMDQMISTPYHIEGFKLWGSMKEWYKGEDGTSLLVYGMGNSKSNVSDPALSLYLRPYEKFDNNLAKDGYRWAMAHYLNPYKIQDMDITSGGGSIADSPIYQNPYWPTEPNMPPLK